MSAISRLITMKHISLSWGNVLVSSEEILSSYQVLILQPIKVLRREEITYPTFMRERYICLSSVYALEEIVRVWSLKFQIKFM